MHRPAPLANAIRWRPASSSDPYARTGSPVFIAPKVLTALHEHWRTTRTHGVLGFLVGDLCEDQEIGGTYLVIDSTIRLNQPIHGDKTAVVVGKLWERIHTELDDGAGYLLGWYHSHPPAGIGLAPEDIETHHRHFDRPWQIALVLGAETTGPAAGLYRPGHDPLSATQRLSFYELAEPVSDDGRGAKGSVLPWTNFVTDDSVARQDRGPIEAARETGAEASTLGVTGQQAEPPAGVPGPRTPSGAAPNPAPIAAAAAPRPRSLGDLPLLHDEPEPAGSAARETGFRRRRSARRAAARRAAGRHERARAGRPAHVRRWLAGVGLVAMAAVAAVGWWGGWIRVGEVHPAVTTDPALVRLDRLGDSVARAITAYTKLVPPFDSGRFTCRELQQGLVAVEDLWVRYNGQGRAPLPALDARRAKDDQLLYALVDGVDRHFLDTGCPRP